MIKFIAFAITGSASMLAEGVHSVVDSGNQGLLLLGGSRAKRRADAEHPFGYGRDRYVYAFLVAMMLFSVGGLFSIYEGIDKIPHPHELENVDSAHRAGRGDRARVVLAAHRDQRVVRTQGRVRGSAFIRHAKAPELPVVLLEDIAALIGLVFALLGVGLTALTDDPLCDGIGTLMIGVLLIVVAIILVIETKSLLLGESAAPVQARTIEAALVGPGSSGSSTCARCTSGPTSCWSARSSPCRAASRWPMSPPRSTRRRHGSARRSRPRGSSTSSRTWTARRDGAGAGRRPARLRLGLAHGDPQLLGDRVPTVRRRAVVRRSSR